MPQESLQKLYTGVSEHLNIGDYDTFIEKMQTPEQRMNFYNSVSKHLDIGNFETFQQKLIPPIEPEKELDLTDIDAALDKKLGDMTSRFQPDIAPAEELPIPTTGVVTEMAVGGEYRFPGRPELRKAPEPTLKESILNVIKKPFVMTPVERSNRAHFIRQIAEDTGLDDTTVDKNYKYLMRKRGHPIDPSITEVLTDIAIFPITAGLASNPTLTVLGVGGFMALSEIENAIVSRIKSEPYKVLAGKGLAELLPSEASQGTKDAVELIDFISKGLLLRGISRKAPKIAQKFTKDIITEYKIRDRMFISAEKIQSMFKTGEKISPYEADIIKSLGLSSKQYRSAVKSGKEIPFKVDRINTMIDKPWYAQLKTLFHIKPLEKPVGVKPPLRIKEKALVKPTEVTEVPVKAPVVPPERITPAEPVIEPKAEITPKITPEVPPEAPVVIPKEKPVTPELKELKAKIKKSEGAKKAYTTRFKDVTLIDPKATTYALRAVQEAGNYKDEAAFFEKVRIGKNYINSKPLAPQVSEDKRDMAVEWYNENSPVPVENWDELTGIAQNDLYEAVKYTPEYEKKKLEREKYYGYTIEELNEMEAQQREFEKEAILERGDKEEIDRGADRNTKSEISDLAQEQEITEEELQTALTEWDRIVKGEKPAVPPEVIRKIKADRTTAMFDTKDSRTGETIKAGEEVYHLTDTGETVKESTYKAMTEGVPQERLFEAVKPVAAEIPTKIPEKEKLPQEAQRYLDEAEKHPERIPKLIDERIPSYIASLGLQRAFGETAEEFEKRRPDIVTRRNDLRKAVEILHKIHREKVEKPRPDMGVPYSVKEEPQLTMIPKLEGKIDMFEKKPLAEKAPEKPGEVEDTYINMGIPLVMPDVVQKKINTIKKLFKEPTGINKRVWDITKDYLGKKAGLKFEYSDKWNKTLRAKVPVKGKKTIFRTQKYKGKFSKQELEDAMSYRQRTGNHFVSETDTFEDVSNRMPQELKDFVDGVVDEHSKNWIKTWNALPFAKDITAREHVIKTYMAGVYAGNINKGYEYLIGLRGRKFVTNNFMTNKKVFLDYQEAFRKAGLVQRYRNIADQMDFQDAYMIRLFANNELIGGIHQLEKEINSKLIVRSVSKLYDGAKAAKDEDGNALYVPYEDPYLRSYVAGKRADGSLIWATTKEPALVYREMSDAVQSIFSKDAYKPENIFWRNYDRIGSLLRYMRVTFSGFHFVPLAESLIGGKGVSVLNIPKWVKHGKKLLNDPIFMTEAKEAGLRFKAPSEVSRSQIEGGIQNIVNVLEAQGIEKKVLAKGIKYITAPQFRLTRFLFDEYLPLLKSQMYYDYKNKALSLTEKKGIQYNETQMKELNREIASIVNDQFGGQAWEMIRVLNDPKIMKWMHRVIGYADWSISALRQAGAIGEGGIRGKLARRYWLRYGIAFLAVQNALSYLFTGLYNDDEEEGKIKWSWEKAHSTFKNIDPTSKHKVDFQLPDIEIDLPLIGKFNPGRQLKKDGTYGRRYYSHFGKQMLEIPRYALNFNEQMFAKSNPVIQIVFKQIFGGAPYKGGIFPARGGYDIAGQYKPWKGKKGFERWRERAIQIVADATPFSIQSMWSTSPATAGLLPISKATSLYASQEYIEKALRKNDANELLNIVASLLDSGYDIKSIKRSITTISKNIIREKVEKEITK